MAYSKIIQFFTKPRINLATMASFDKRAQSLRRQFEQDNRPLPKLTLGAINRDGMLAAKSSYYFFACSC